MKLDLTGLNVTAIFEDFVYHTKFALQVVFIIFTTEKIAILQHLYKNVPFQVT